MNLTGIDFSPEQKRIFDRLMQLNVRAANCYFGALHVLEMSDNPDRIAQSAHSIREMTILLARDAAVPSWYSAASHNEDVSEALCRNCRANIGSDKLTAKLSAKFDPYSKYHRKTDVYREWNKLHTRFVTASHHGEPSDISEYRELLIALENVLANLIFSSQVASRDNIDAIVKSGPNAVDIQSLKKLLSRTLEEDRYFFQTATPDWLPLLESHGFFTNPPAVVLESNDYIHPGWPEAEFLARAASTYPNEVLKIMVQCSTGELDVPANRNVIDNFATALTEMPANIASQSIKKITKEKWVQRGLTGMAPFRFISLLRKLIKEEQLKPAIALARQLLTTEETSRHKLGDHVMVNVEPLLANHLCIDVLDAFDAVVPSELAQCISMLCYKLHDVLETECDSEGDLAERRSDSSSVWRPSIGDHEQNWETDEFKSALVQKIRDLGERYLGSLAQEDLPEAIDLMFRLKTDFAIFRRFKLYFCRQFLDGTYPLTHKLALHEIDDYDCWHEWCRLVSATFNQFPPQRRKEFLDRIARGPLRHEEDFQNRWRAKRLAILKRNLTDAELFGFGIDLTDVPPVEELEFSCQLKLQEESVSPIELEELSQMDQRELLQTLLEFEPTGDFMGPSRHGLAQKLTIHAESKPMEFSANLTDMYKAGVHPTYLCHSAEGILQSRTPVEQIDFAGILSCATAVVADWKDGRLRLAKNQDVLDANWNDALGSFLRLVSHYAFDSNTTDERALSALPLVLELCFFPDPTAHEEEEWIGYKRDALNFALNSVRGRALHELLMFWFTKHKRLQPDTAIEVWGRIQNHLRDILSETPRSISLNAIIGYFVPGLIEANPDLAREIYQSVFPTDNRRLRYVAWEAFLLHGFHADTFQFCRDKYELAVRELPSPVDYTKFQQDPCVGLAKSLVNAYLLGYESLNDSLFARFIEHANVSQRKEAIKFLAKVKPPASDDLRLRMKNFWEARLTVADAEELTAFGAWTITPVFDTAEMLDLLHRTLSITGGRISGGSHFVLKFLHGAVVQNPAGVIEIIDQLVTNGPNDYFMMIEHLMEILHVVLAAQDEAAATKAEIIRDRLLALGFDQFRHLVRSAQPL